MSLTASVLLIALGAGVMGFVVCALCVLGFVLAMPAIDAWLLERFNGYMNSIAQTRVTPLDPGIASDLAERELFEFVNMREKLDEQIARRQHVRDGGYPGDSPTKWKKQRENK